MKRCVPWVAALMLSPLGNVCLGQGSAFTYQGRLTGHGTRANGNYDLIFTLYDAASGGAPQGPTITNLATVVGNGLFMVTLDFGDQFNGAGRWLQIGVRTNGAGVFSILPGRQLLTTVPYAVTARNVTGPVKASQLNGTISPAQLPANVITNGARNVNLSGSLTGNLIGHASTADFAATADKATSLSGQIVGTNLVPGTVNSNAFDAATLALFGAGASETNWPNSAVWLTNNDTRNIEFDATLSVADSLTTFSPEYALSKTVLTHGSLWLPSGMYGGPNDTAIPTSWWSGAIQWGGTNHASYPIDDIDAGQANSLAKIQYFYDWGNGAGIFSPWMIITAGNIRLEEGYELGKGGGWLLLGNEAHWGNVLVNYQPIAWDGYVTNGWSKPVVFTAVGMGPATNFIFSHPGIVGRSIQSANTYGPGGQDYAAGELWFYSAAPYAHATGNMSDHPGTVVAKMHTNSWEFVEGVTLIGDGSGLTNLHLSQFATGSVSDGLLPRDQTNKIFWGSAAATNYTYTDSTGWNNTNTAGGGVNIARGTVTANNWKPGSVATLALGGAGSTNVLGLDLASHNTFQLTLTTNAHFDIPANLTAAQSFTVFLYQDGTGTHTVSFNTNAARRWKFSGGIPPRATTNANALDIWSCVVGSYGSNVYVLQTSNLQ